MALHVRNKLCWLPTLLSGSSVVFQSLILLPMAYAQIDLPTATSSILVGPPRSTAISDRPTTLSTAVAATNTSSISLALSSTSRSDTAPNTTPNPNTNSGQPDDDTQDQKSGLLNYYFVFLALFILLLCLGVYFVHRRKRQLKARYRTSGQDALARDIDGWTNTRRWMQGHWRTNSNSHSQMEDNRHEGLNELGEAPPPYKAAASEAGGPQPQIPLETLSQDEATMLPKPPDYGDSPRADREATDEERPNTGLPFAETGPSDPDSSDHRQSRRDLFR